MSASNNAPVNDTPQKIEATIIQLKTWLEDIVEMRVECAKLEFNMLSLYHTVCPEVLNGVYDDLQNVNNTENPPNRDNDVQ